MSLIDYVEIREIVIKNSVRRYFVKITPKKIQDKTRQKYLWEIIL